MGLHFKFVFRILIFSLVWVMSDLSARAESRRLVKSSLHASHQGESQKKDQEECDFHFKKMGWCGTLTWVIPPKKVEMITEKDQAEFNLMICPKKSVREHRGGSKAGVSEKIDLKKSFDRLHVRLWMPSMGHGSRPTRVREVSSEGGCLKFHVSQLYFSMPGDWEIQAEIQKDQKVFDHARCAYDL